MAIKLTEARLRQIIREEARKLVEYAEGMDDDNSWAASEALAALENELDRGAPVSPDGLAFKVVSYDDNARNFGSGNQASGDLVAFFSNLAEAWGEKTGEYFEMPASPAVRERGAVCIKVLNKWEAQNSAKIEKLQASLSDY